jgi:uncharacterized membrane protein (DUF106 family)|tara:strand:+ start:94 stop:498 length:405 start_codon:yes stop_codon:yes gene_type:complete
MTLTDLIISNPKISVVTISFFITLAMTLVTKFFTDQIRMKELKEEQKKHQANLKEHKGDLEKQKKIQKDMMESSMELMKHAFKPMLITFLPIIIIFWWIRGIYLETVIANTWLWWYIGTSIGSSIILRKILDVV